MSDVGIVYFARSTHSTLKDLSSLGDVPPQYIDIDHMAYPILRKVMKSIGSDVTGWSVNQSTIWNGMRYS
jgi:hypothetical protein